MKKRPIQAYACMALGLLLAGLVGFIWGRGSLIIARETMEILKTEAYYGTTPDELDQAAAKGMIDLLKDPMAAYLAPALMENFSLQLSGEKTVGLGLETVRIAYGYYVCTVLENSPAQIGGIAKGDIIVSIGGICINEGAVWTSFTDGQKVELGISRNGIVRTQTMFAASMEPFEDVEQMWLRESIGYVRIRSFTQDGMEEQAIEALRTCLAKGDAVLDLRHNPGGRLDAALAIAGAFVPKGETLLTLNEANGNREVYRSEDGSLCGGRVFVLVDDQSASASEVLAGILRDYGAAVIIGQQTYGKGTVQRVVQLKNGGGIRFTVAEYTLPSGLAINGVGITPDMSAAAEEIPGWAKTPEQDEILQFALTQMIMANP